MEKDRESVHPIAAAEDVQIVYRRTGRRPVEYAILLQVRGPNGWATHALADNPHADLHVDQHHWHRYVDGEQQSAEPLPFEVSGTDDAMGTIIDWFAENWTEQI